MNEDKFHLLEEELSDLESAATHLRYSIGQTHDLFKQSDWQPEKLKRWDKWPADLYASNSMLSFSKLSPSKNSGRTVFMFNACRFNNMPPN